MSKKACKGFECCPWTEMAHQINIQKAGQLQFDRSMLGSNKTPNQTAKI